MPTAATAKLPGTYTVTYRTNGNCPQSSSRVVTINDLDDASFSYAKAAYCVNESDPSAIITGTTLGKFTSSPALVFTNTYSGTIDLDRSQYERAKTAYRTTTGYTASTPNT